MQPDQLVAELLARGDMNDDTVVELNRILEDWRNGRLDGDDEAYLRALHARLMNISAETAAGASPAAGDRLDGLSIAEWRDRALKAEEALSRFEDAARNA